MQAQLSKSKTDVSCQEHLAGRNIQKDNIKIKMFQCLCAFCLKLHTVALRVFFFQEVMKDEVAEERFEWASTKVPTLCVIIKRWPRTWTLSCVVMPSLRCPSICVLLAANNRSEIEVAGDISSGKSGARCVVLVTAKAGLCRCPWC